VSGGHEVDADGHGPRNPSGGDEVSGSWEPGLGDHLQTIWRRKWFILAGAAAVAEVVFLLLSFTVEPRYESEASLRLTVESDGALLLDGDRVEYASRVYAELAESPAVLSEAVERSGLDLDLDQAGAAIDVEWARPPGFIDISASLASPDDAAALADGMAAALMATIAADSERLGGEDGDGNTADNSTTSEGGTVLGAALVEPAVAASSPASPRPLRDAVAAFVIALVVLAEVAALWRPVRGLLPLSRTAELVTELVGVPSLTLTGDPEDRTRLGSFAARHLMSVPAIVAVHCSSDARPAAPARLGEALTAVGRRTLVADADRRDPSLHWWLSLPRRPGLEDIARGEATVGEAAFRSEARAEVSLLTAGGDGDEGRDGDGDRGPGGQPTDSDDHLLDTLGADHDCVLVYVGADAALEGIASTVAGLRSSTVLIIDPERMTRRRLAELVHGYGGHEDVIAILLMSKAAAAAETRRLSAKSWTRGDGRRIESITPPRRLGPFRTGRRAS